jgi:hypothetical protein
VRTWICKTRKGEFDVWNSTCRTRNADSGSVLRRVETLLPRSAQLTVGCASDDDDDLATNCIDASTDGKDASTSDSDTVPLIIWSVDVGALKDGVGTLITMVL